MFNHHFFLKTIVTSDIAGSLHLCKWIYSSVTSQKWCSCGSFLACFSSFLLTCCSLEKTIIQIHKLVKVSSWAGTSCCWISSKMVGQLCRCSTCSLHLFDWGQRWWKIAQLLSFWWPLDKTVHFTCAKLIDSWFRRVVSKHDWFEIDAWLIIIHRCIFINLWKMISWILLRNIHIIIIVRRAAKELRLNPLIIIILADQVWWFNILHLCVN